MEAGRLGQILINARALRPEDLELALAEQRRAGGKLGEILIRMNLVTEDQVTGALATQLNVATASLDPLPTVSAEVLARIPASLAHGWLVLPLELREEDRTLVVATADLLKGHRLEELREHARCWIVPKLAGRNALKRAIGALYGPSRPTDVSALRNSAEPPLRAVDPKPTRREVTPRPTAEVHPLAPRAQVSHPEVKALVKLLLDKGLVTAAEVHASFKDVSSRSSTNPNQAEVE